MTFDDDIIARYLRGNLDAETSAALEAAVETDDVLAARIMKADPARDAVRDAFAALTPPANLMPTSDTSARGKSLSWIAAGCAALGIGVGLYTSSRPAAPAWQVQAAQYQALYSPDTIAMITTTPDALASQFATLGENLGRSLDPGNLTDVEGLTLLRGQVLGFKGEPLGQIVFADRAGKPIALCIMQIDGAGESALREATLSGLEALSWSEGGYQYLLIGESSFEELRDWAETLQTRI